jgi:hypothetical protein
MTPDNLLLVAPAAVVAAVKAVRDSFPKIDGLMVLGAAAIAGTGISWLVGPAGEPIRDMIARGVFWGFAGSGFMAIVDRASK